MDFVQLDVADPDARSRQRRGERNAATILTQLVNRLVKPFRPQRGVELQFLPLVNSRPQWLCRPLDQHQGFDQSGECHGQVRTVRLVVQLSLQILHDVAVRPQTREACDAEQHQHQQDEPQSNDQLAANGSRQEHSTSLSWLEESPRIFEGLQTLQALPSSLNPGSRTAREP